MRKLSRTRLTWVFDLLVEIRQSVDVGHVVHRYLLDDVWVGGPVCSNYMVRQYIRVVLLL